MYRIAVIGERESVLGFRAVGLTACAVESTEEARDALHRMAKENYAIIYITERLYAALSGDVARYAEEPLPAIIPIPGREGPTGLAAADVSAAVERAVGADIQ